MGYVGLSSAIPRVQVLLESHVSTLCYSQMRDTCMQLSNGIPLIPVFLELHVRPMLQSNVGHVGLSNGIQRVPMSLESHVSVLSYCHMWDTWDSQVESGMY